MAGTAARLDRVFELLPGYIHGIDDLISLLQVSRNVRTSTLDGLTPPHLFAICHRSRRSPLFTPSEWYLLSLIASGISQWIAQSNKHRIAFKQACVGGSESLLDLGLKYPSVPTLANFNLDKLNVYHEKRYSIINPLTDLVDKCIGKQWYDTPDFWDGGRADAATLFAEPNETVFQLIIYGELFGNGFDDYLHWLFSDGDETSMIDKLKTWGTLEGGEWCGPSTRLEFIKYCLADWHIGIAHSPRWAGENKIASSYPPSPTAVPIQASYPYPHPDRPPWAEGAVLNVHPLRAAVPNTGGPSDGQPPEHATCLEHLLIQSPLWGRIAKDVRRQAVPAVCEDGTSVAEGEQSSTGHGADFSKSVYEHQWDETLGWRQNLWENVLWTGGWNGAEMFARVWAEDADNDKARALDRLRIQDLNPTGESQAQARTKVEAPSNRFSALRDIIAKLPLEPKQIILQAKGERPWRRTASTYVLPYLVGDLQIATYNVM